MMHPGFLFTAAWTVLVVVVVGGSDAFSPVSYSRRYSTLQQRTQKVLLQTPFTKQKEATSSALVVRGGDVTTTRPQPSSTTTLDMHPTRTIAAITGAISGGLFAGGLHAIAGPDHLAALLPQCCGQRWYRAGRVGALWAFGHGISACLLGVLAFGLKNTFTSSMNPRIKTLLSGASHLTEVAVGLSLVFIGMLGIKEAREWKDEIEGVQPQSLSAAAADAGIKSANQRTLIFNGLLHGFSWDGAPSLAPALAVASWTGNLAFLSSYALGTMATMAVTTTLIGEGTRRAGQVFQRPDIPQKLSLFSSMIAIFIGVLWCGLALR